MSESKTIIEEHCYENGSKYFKYEIKNGLVKYHYLYDRYKRDCKLPEGKIVVWKACQMNGIGVYVKLGIPAAAKRETVHHLWCGRVASAIVLEISDTQGYTYNTCESAYSPNKLKYVVGQYVHAHKFTDNIDTGIFVYMHKDQCDCWIKDIEQQNSQEYDLEEEEDEETTIGDEYERLLR